MNYKYHNVHMYFFLKIFFWASDYPFCTILHYFIWDVVGVVFGVLS